MLCPNCQTENPEGAKFCAKCGNPLTPLQVSPSPPSTLPQESNTVSAIKKSFPWIFLIVFILLTLFVGALVILLVVILPARSREQAKWRKVGEVVRSTLETPSSVSSGGFSQHLKSPLPTGFEQYSSSSFTILYLSDWGKEIKLSPDGRTEYTRFVNFRDGGDVDLLVGIRKVEPPGADLDAITDTFLDRLKQRRPDVTMIGRSPSVISGKQAVDLKYSFSVNGVGMTERMVTVKNGDALYVLEAVTSSEKFNAYEETFSVMINSFTIK